MSKSIRIPSLDALPGAAAEFVRYVSAADLPSNIFAFFGRMGAGKTTFITALCRELGVPDTVNSPTFTIVNEYRAAKGFPVYHFDFYRIDNLSEACDLGLDEYFSADGLCLIEWPEKIADILPAETVRVDVRVAEDDCRELLIRG